MNGEIPDKHQWPLCLKLCSSHFPLGTYMDSYFCLPARQGTVLNGFPGSSDAMNFWLTSKDLFIYLFLTHRWKDWLSRAYILSTLGLELYVRFLTSSL